MYAGMLQQRPGLHATVCVCVCVCVCKGSSSILHLPPLLSYNLILFTSYMTLLTKRMGI